MPGPGSLGAFPEGDPQALLDLSRELRAKGKEGAVSCLALMMLPKSVTFVGGAGDRFRRYANATGHAGVGIAAAFNEAAALAKADALELEKDQKDWYRRRDALLKQLREEAAAERAAAAARAQEARR